MYFNSFWTDLEQFLVRNEGAPSAPHPAGVRTPPVPSINRGGGGHALLGERGDSSALTFATEKPIQRIQRAVQIL